MRLTGARYQVLLIFCDFYESGVKQNVEEFFSEHSVIRVLHIIAKILNDRSDTFIIAHHCHQLKSLPPVKIGVRPRPVGTLNPHFVNEAGYSMELQFEEQLTISHCYQINRDHHHDHPAISVHTRTLSLTQSHCHSQVYRKITLQVEQSCLNPTPP